LRREEGDPKGGRLTKSKKRQRPRGMPLVVETTANHGEMSLASVREAFVSDFYDSWTALAAQPNATGRGNFMYAFMATNYLEWASTIAHQDPTVAQSFAAALAGRDRHSFMKLPAPWPQRPRNWFPFAGDVGGDRFLWAVFDLVRNGLAHRYQQIDAVLTDGRFRVQIIGAAAQPYQADRERPRTHFRPFEVHRPPNPRYLVVRLYPDVLFADIDAAVSVSGLLNLGTLKFRRQYPISIARLRKAVGVGKRKT
jgi:hypothetical protein